MSKCSHSVHNSHSEIKYEGIPYTNPVIHVVGRRQPNGDYISADLNGSKYVYLFLLDGVNGFCLPVPSAVKLCFCWGVCASKPEYLTKGEEVEHVINGGAEVFMRFLGELFTDVKNILTEFNGEVIGYYASVLN